jgi:hypothetical protein
MNLPDLRTVRASLVLALSVSCSSTHSETAPLDAGLIVIDASEGDTSSSDGETSTGPYPAFMPDIGQILTGDGPIFSSARIVTITWAEDPTSGALTEFSEELGPSKYWRVLGEYGLGPATSAPADQVVITTPAPSTWLATDIPTWLATNLNDPSSTWPAPDENTVYFVVTPPNTEITNGGIAACASGVGSTGLVSVFQNPNVPYAIEYGSCEWSGTVEDSDTAGGAANLVVAVTDPQYFNDPAWGGYDPEHYAWELFVGGSDQLGFLCADYTNAYFRALPDLPYAVMRIWSNASAAAGHSPCVPAEPGAYYNATPLDMQVMGVTVGWAGLAPAEVEAKGYRIAPGTTGTFKVGLYSDAPTDAWSVQAVEGDGQNAPPTPVLTLSTDKSLGNNGDVVTVTVAVSAAPPGQTGELMTVVSTQNQLPHYVPILIGIY